MGETDVKILSKGYFIKQWLDIHIFNYSISFDIKECRLLLPGDLESDLLC